MHIQRREFLVSTAAFACGGMQLAASAAAAPPKESAAMFPIVDTHQHLWDLEKFRLPWLAGSKVLNRSFVTKDFLQATEGLGVVKAVYMEVDVDPAQQVDEAEHVIALSKDSAHPTAAAVISGRPASEGFAAYIERFSKSPYIKGVRQVLHVSETKKGFCLEEKFVAGIRLLGEKGLSFDLCMRPTDLGDANQLVERCPQTRFILDHCGNADPPAFRKTSGRESAAAEAWRRNISELAKRPNLICKISGIIARVPRDWAPDDLVPIVNHCLDEFGPDRVVFGGDWPVCTLGATYRQWVEALKAIIGSRPVEEQKKLLSENAIKFYSLS